MYSNTLERTLTKKRILDSLSSDFRFAERACLLSAFAPVHFDPNDKTPVQAAGPTSVTVFRSITDSLSLIDFLITVLTGLTRATPLRYTEDAELLLRSAGGGGRVNTCTNLSCCFGKFDREIYWMGGRQVRMVSD